MHKTYSQHSFFERLGKARRAKGFFLKEKSFYHTVYQFSQNAKGRKKILADFLLRSSAEAALMTMEDMAETVGASAGTISRTVRQMGFESFSQLQTLMRKEILKNLSPADRLQKLPAAPTFSDSLTQDKDNIALLSSLNDDKAFSEACELLAKAPSVYIFGLRSSFPAAYFLSICLEQIRHNVHLLDVATGKFPEQINRLNPSDLVVAFSFPRYLKEPVVMAEEARNKQCQIISFSDSALSPVGLLSDIALVSPYASASFFNSSTAIFALINALLTQTMLLLGKKGREELKRFEAIQNKLSQ